jgi:hypothetical protein
MPVQPGLGGTNSRPLGDTVSQQGPGLPDDAVGPEQRTLPDQLELALTPEADAIARKLAREVAQWTGDEDEGIAPEDDPTGHA